MRLAVALVLAALGGPPAPAADRFDLHCVVSNLHGPDGQPSRSKGP